MKRLDNKVVIITGGAGGIGSAASRIFAAEGAKVVIADLDEKAGIALAAEINAAGGNCCFVKCDVSDSTSVRNVLDICKTQFGGLDVIYNNAGVYLANKDGRITDIEEDIWEKVLAINLRSVFLFGTGRRKHHQHCFQRRYDRDPQLRRIHRHKRRHRPADKIHGGRVRQIQCPYKLHFSRRDHDADGQDQQSARLRCFR